MSQPSSQQEWSAEYQRWLRLQWSDQHQQWYFVHYVDGQWVFFHWCPQARPISDAAPRDAAPREGAPIFGTYHPGTSQPGLHYERLDQSYYVRSKEYFIPGRVFSVVFSEPAGTTATSYNDAVTMVRYGEMAYTQVRRFVVVRQRKAFCYAVPIFTYDNQGTLKPGVEPNEHAVAYSWGQQPKSLPGEYTFTKQPICIVMTDSGRPLSAASRIFFGIQHPIQYNVKVKDIGYVIPDDLSNLMGYWNMENHGSYDGSLDSSMHDVHYGRYLNPTNEGIGIEGHNTGGSDVGRSKLERFSENRKQNTDDSVSKQDNDDNVTKQDNDDITSKQDNDDNVTKQDNDDSTSKQDNDDSTSKQDNDDNVTKQDNDDSTSKQDNDDNVTKQDNDDSTSKQENDDSIGMGHEANPSTQELPSEPTEAKIPPSVPLSSNLNYESVTNARAFFKKGRVFITAWEHSTASISSGCFAVVKSKPTHCICLRISPAPASSSGKAKMVVDNYGPVITTETANTEPPPEDQPLDRTIFVKVENGSIGLESGSRIDFGKPHVLGYDIKIHNVGRVFGDSIGRMERNFAANMGFTKET